MSGRNTSDSDGVVAVDDIRLQSHSCDPDSPDDPFTLKDFEVQASSFSIVEDDGNTNWTLNRTGLEVDHTLGTTDGHYAAWQTDGGGNVTLKGSIMSPNYTMYQEPQE